MHFFSLLPSKIILIISAHVERKSFKNRKSRRIPSYEKQIFWQQRESRAADERKFSFSFSVENLFSLSKPVLTHTLVCIFIHIQLRELAKVYLKTRKFCVRLRLTHKIFTLFLSFRYDMCVSHQLDHANANDDDDDDNVGKLLFSNTNILYSSYKREFVPNTQKCLLSGCFLANVKN